jgi:hypothetical protein
LSFGFGFRLARFTFESVEAIGPEALIEAQPLVCLRQAVGVEAAKVLPSLHGPAHEACALERLYVLGGAGERHAQGSSQVADRQFAAGKTAQHSSPRRVGESMEDSVEMRGTLLNHLVEQIYTYAEIVNRWFNDGKS